MAEPLVIIVHGLPGPQGSKAFKGMRRNKKGALRGVLVESSKKVKPWRLAVQLAAAPLVAGAEPIDGPINARMVFTLPKPASAPKRRRSYPMRMPDLSKLARSTEDALTDAGVWADDARLIEYTRLAKVYPGEDPEALDAPGVRITIERVAA